jgi:stearoyl-CoA desaturase (Delta-9 desaturase)
MHHALDAPKTARPADPADEIDYLSMVPFLLVHAACFAAFYTGVTIEAVFLCVVLYVLRIFGIGAGYHRYFSHRTYKTSRVFQFLLALLSQTSSQRGALWWASKHRRHHRHSDTVLDAHSPSQHGFLRAHFLWFFTDRHNNTELEAIADFARFPELRWLDRYHYVPPAALGVLCWAIAGWPGVVVGFCWSTVLLWHGTFTINSLAHVFGRRRYVTGDDSRNNWLLALITMGEGWHNNHHAYQSSVRQGFRWWEYDPTFYVLKALSWIGIVWDLHSPPAAVLRGEQRLGQNVIEKAARQVAASLPIDRITERALAALAHTPSWAELRERALAATHNAEAFLAELSLPHVPTLEEIRRHAEQRLARTPSLDQIADRARELVAEAISRRLLQAAAAPA